MMKKLLSVICLIVSLMSLASAQSYMDRAEVFERDSLHYKVRNSYFTVKWTGKHDRYLYFSEKQKDGDEIVWLVDSRNWKKSLVYKDSEIMSRFPSGTDGKKEAKLNLGLYNIHFDEQDISRFYVDKGKKHYCYNWRKEEWSETDDSYAGKGNRYPGHNWRYSQDSLYRMVCVDNQLCLGVDDSLVCLTSDGEKDHSYGLKGTGPEKSKAEISVQGMWQKKGHHFIGHRKDCRNVGSLTLVDNLSERPEPKTYLFPMPGDTAVFRYDFYYVDADQRSFRRLTELEKYKDQEMYLPRFGQYCQSGDYVYLMASNRQRDTLELFRVDLRNGEVRNIITEECKPHFNEMMMSFHVLNEGKDILWWSERTGKGKFYHYDQDGRLLNPVMKQEFVSGAVHSIDTAARTFIFEGYGANPAVNPDYRYFYKGSIDGKFEPVLLTPGNGTHCIELSPEKKYIFDKYSRMDMAPRHQICDMKGRVLYELPSADVSELEKCGWKYPEVVEFMAADSVTKLYGVVYLPFEMEPGRKYPIITDVYPGPQMDLVPREFSLDDNYNHSLAQLGFIVVNVSYRGSNPHRGRDFYNFGYGNLRDYALDDNYAVIQQVAQRYPGDLDRVGIYGHSGGGFMAAAAMLTRPDFYKAGVAASGNHDNNIYTQWWGESFHGVHRVAGKDGKPAFECKIPTNIELAGNLKGKLLLITGDMDNNVHPANTMRLAHALIKAGKRFDMLVIPGTDHSLGTPSYYTNVLRYYFVENLLGLPQKDINIINHN